jgi:hypothetical protein
MNIDELAKEAGFDHYLTVRDFPKQLERFAALVCEATKAEALAKSPVDYDQGFIDGFVDGFETQVAEQDHIANAGKMIAEPVKQEPVAWAYIDADGSFMDALDRQHGAYQTPLYAAPVNAKDIRESALEEAAKVVETTKLSNWFQSDCAAAIRRMK